MPDSRAVLPRICLEMMEHEAKGSEDPAPTLLPDEQGCDKTQWLEVA